MSSGSWAGLTLAGVMLLPVVAAAQQPRRVEQLTTTDGVRLDYPADGVWRVRARQVMATRARLLAQRRFAALNAALAPGARPSLAMATAVAGVLRIPTILVAYTNTDTTTLPPAAKYDSVFNTSVPLAGRPYTVRTLYEEMSGSLLSVQGTVYGWVPLDTTSAFYLTACGGGGANALNCPLGRQRLHDLIVAALSKLDATVDFSQFDADGDGFVDDLRVVQPMLSGECGGPGYASHHFSLDGLDTTGSGAFTTNDPWPGHPGKFIRVDSYHLVAGVGGTTCFIATQIAPIGPASHELGHGLGLPDLYDVSYATAGIGEWGLMSTALYTSLNSPGHHDAWSKQQLGWVTVTPLSTDGTYAIDPVVTSHQIYFVRAQGANPRGEYFLLENKQALGADTANLETGGQAGPKVGGLLVWHIDSTQVVTHSILINPLDPDYNRVNVGPIHGVELVQADALRQLDGLSSPNRGDAGDPYPGSSRNALYSFNGAPPALKNSDGSFVGFAIDSIAQVVPNGQMRFRIRFGVTAATLSVAAVVSQLLNNDLSLSPADQRYLDFLGNNNGVYDLGDFLAWVRRTGATPP